VTEREKGIDFNGLDAPSDISGVVQVGLVDTHFITNKVKRFVALRSCPDGILEGQ
jgi:hypothetical protein